MSAHAQTSTFHRAGAAQHVDGRPDGNDLDLGDRAAKRFATLQARAAIAGISLRRNDGHESETRYIACRWPVPTEFSDIESVEEWLSSVLCERSRDGV